VCFSYVAATHLRHFAKPLWEIVMPTLCHLACTALAVTLTASAQQHQTAAKPWMDRSLSPDRRAELVLEQMTLDEKLQLVHGTGWGVLRAGDPVPERSNRGAGYVPGIPRLGIPDLNLADSAVGVRMAAPESRYATLLPSALGLAATWDTTAAHLYGVVIGRELRAQGFNMSIGGGVDIMREPRNGRNFEYAGEDPILAGNIVGNLALGVQSQHVMGDIKHYAVNDQETGRNVVDVHMDKRTLRETDLLAFEIAIKLAQPAGVMCSYNLVNGEHTCENDYLLNQVLKKDWGFKGWVLSDWEATHSTVKAANAGLDQEMPGEIYFGAPLRQAIADGKVPMSRLNDMDLRILRSMFANGVIDEPPVRRVVDPFQGRDDARHIAEESIVLLKNANQLPLEASTLHRIAIIGGHADIGILSGGGSAQVDAPGGNPLSPSGASEWGKPVFFRSSPMKAIQRLAPSATVAFASGDDLAQATQLARSSDIAIVFATQYMSEGGDNATLSLPGQQDALIAAVAAANPHTIVVLETGGPVSMPWADKVGGIFSAWYPGIGGGEAIADLLFGVVNPSGKLPATFARTEADLPLPRIPGMNLSADNKPIEDLSSDTHRQFEMSYPEGLAVGYRWFQLKHRTPLFAFGHGLSYTTFRYSTLKLDAAGHMAEFTLTNTGKVAGAEVAQLYVTLPTASGEPFQRLAGWQRVQLNPGESRRVTIALTDVSLSIFDTAADRWSILPGDYMVAIGTASDAANLTGILHLP
jgi:beta-glucosidase